MGYSRGNGKYVRNGIWVGPTGPNLYKENQSAYGYLHRYVRQRLRRPQDGMCTNCHERTATGLANTDGQYSVDLKTFEWQCQKCNLNHPLTLVKNSAARKKQWADPEARANHSAGMKRRFADPEEREKMRQLKLGKKLGPYRKKNRAVVNE
jgi:hypothetical protein